MKEEQPLLAATGESLETFHEDVQYLWSCSDIPVYDNPPSALQFLRNHVAASRPCIIRNSIQLRDPSDNADAAGSTPLTMSLDDLVRLFPKAEKNGVATSEAGSSPFSSSLPPLCVDVTPDGHGDCLRKVRAIIDNDAAFSVQSKQEERVFVKPLETKMDLSDFCRRLRKGRAKQHRHYHNENDRTEILDKVFESFSSRVSLDGDDSNRNETTNAGDNDSFFEECVLYYSRQNDCLREELSPLWNLTWSLLEPKRSDGDANDNSEDGDDSFVFPRSFPWAEEAFFGQKPSSDSSSINPGPDAVNLWIGDERAVSAMHKDHYENIFYVLSGEKVFGLCPPSDTPFLYEQEVLSGRFEVSYEEKGGKESHNDAEGRKSNPQNKWSVVLDREENDVAANTNTPSSTADKDYSKVHWIATDIFERRSDNSNDFPLSKYAHPVTVKVRAGELLYLPSLWFHRVTQTRETVAINYWYDMNFESPLWCYFHLLQQLRPIERISTTDESDT